MTGKNNTGVALFEVKGPLINLLENLSGKDGNLWLAELKKLLRGEKPQLSFEIEELLQKFNSRENALEKINQWAAFLKNFPAVSSADFPVDGDKEDLLYIEVFACLENFLIGKEEDAGSGTAQFTFNSDFTVYLSCPAEKPDATFNSWKKESYENMKDFCKALLELGEMYNKTIPEAAL